MSDVIITGPGAYRTIDGRKVTIGRKEPDGVWDATDLKMMSSSGVRYNSCDSSWQRYLDDGSVYSERDGEENDRIVGPWVERVMSPVQEVTERRIVPGVYGVIAVAKRGDKFNFGLPVDSYTPAELRDAARVLTEIAEFIDNGS
jgi:hypothetical protein